MATTHPGITGRAIDIREPPPLLVRPRVAWRMLGCGNTYGYKLLNAGELESFVDGKARKITVASIHGYIERKLTAESTTMQTALLLRRGLTKKHRRKGNAMTDARTGTAVGEERRGDSVT